METAVAEQDVARLLAAAADGDQRSWSLLIDVYGHLVWTVARSFQLDRADAADVSQNTWLRLVEHLRDIREPGRLGSWLVTTARREALALIRQSGRTVPTGDLWRLDWPDPDEPPERQVERRDEVAAVRCAFRQLTGPCQQLLYLMVAEPPPTYAEISAAMEIPIGSIGPARARCLAQLGRLLPHHRS